MNVRTKDLQILGEFFESPTYKIYRKYFLDDRRISLLESSISAGTIEDIKYFRGGVDHIDWSKQTAKEIHKKYVQSENKDSSFEEV